jgi:hypothetical protein
VHEDGPVAGRSGTAREHGGQQDKTDETPTHPFDGTPAYRRCPAFDWKNATADEGYPPHVFNSWRRLN